MRELYLKRVSTFLLAAALFGGIFAHSTTAIAQVVPTLDSPNLAANTTNAQANVSQQTKEFALDTIAYGVGRQIIRHITQSTVNWINSGFKGSPTFIQNPGEFFTDLGYQITGQFIDELGLGFLCEPFEFGISFALNLGTQNHLDRYECTALEIIENFQHGPVQLDAFFDVAVTTNNNPYGIYVETKNELEKRIANRLGIEKTVLDFGDGFYSLKDSDGNITTPGKLIEDQLASVTSSDIRQLELADELNEIIGAMANTLIRSVITGGLSGASRGGSNAPTQQYVDNIRDIDFENERGAIEDGDLFESEGDSNFSVSIDESQREIFDSRLDQNSSGVNLAAFLNSAAERNLALGKQAQQSATVIINQRAQIAGEAIDGNSRGELLAGSPLAISDAVETEFAWWEVDLGEEFELTRVNIYRRTGLIDEDDEEGDVFGVVETLGTPIHVIFYDKEDNIIETRSVDVANADLPVVVDDVDFAAQKVRIQRTTPGDSEIVGDLHLAEVEVYGYDNIDSQNVASLGVASQSRDYNHKYPASNAIDRRRDGNTPAIALTSDVANVPWWEIDLNRTYRLKQLIIYHYSHIGRSADLDNAYVVVSNERLPQDLVPTQIESDPRVIAVYRIPQQQSNPRVLGENVLNDVEGRFVRIIHANGNSRMDIQEVEILAVPARE